MRTRVDAIIENSDLAVCNHLVDQTDVYALGPPVRVTQARIDFCRRDCASPMQSRCSRRPNPLLRNIMLVSVLGIPQPEKRATEPSDGQRTWNFKPEHHAIEGGVRRNALAEGSHLIFNEAHQSVAKSAVVEALPYQAVYLQ